jgi:hypothetical protein
VSYDLSINANDTFSQYTSATDLRSFIGQLDNVHPNGEWNFVLGDGESDWMEIDLEVVTEEGDFCEDCSPELSGINCIRLHIPYPFMSDDWQQTYLPTALAIANHLHWPLLDEQTGQTIIEFTKEVRSTHKPWWKFW